MRLVVRGARENNLAGVDLDLPLGALVVFAGPSGSGKSSLAFDTLHAEGQRRYLEAASAARAAPASLSAPRVDLVEGLPPTVALDQRAEAPPRGATVASVAGCDAPLRLILGRAGALRCPTCGDAIHPATHDEIVAAALRLGDGATVLVEAPVRARGEATAASLLDAVARAGFARVRVGGRVARLDGLSARDLDGASGVASGVAVDLRVVVDRVRLGPGRADRVHDAVRTAARAGQGEVVLVDEAGGERRFVDRPRCPRDDLDLPALEPRLLDPRAAVGRCPACDGSGLQGDSPCESCDGLGLSEVARAVRFRGEGLGDLLGRTVAEALVVARAWPTDPVADRPTADWIARLQRLVELGLGYLPLSRRAAELSSGELQRLRLARHVGGHLSGVLYALDEPAAGLADAAVAGVVAALRALVAAGNSVVAVEHHPAVIAAADRVVEFGPGAGRAGGRVVFEGDVAGLRAADTATGRWLSGRERLEPGPGRASRGAVRAEGARGGNLAGDPVSLALGALVAVVGPSGSGKTRLLDALVARLRPDGPGEGAPPVASIRGGERLTRVVAVDRRSVARSPRSNVATFTGLWDVLRDLLAQTAEAKVRGLSAGSFSLAVKGGRCEACKGSGVRRIDLQWLPDVFLPCPVCDGRRFAADVLGVRWKGLAPDELLALPVAEARPVLAGHPELEAVLRALDEVGLGYLPLGQAGHTWSGGEAQRLLLARELARANRRGAEGALFVLDDPTVGLHPADVAVLLRLLRRLVDEGATVWLATHDPALAAACDARVHLGPGAGPDGGRVLTAP
jgi:excinuclease ABC subunit A